MNSRGSAAGARFVFFDMGGTVLRVQPSVGHVYAETAGRHGFSVDPSWLAPRFGRAWHEALRRSGYRSHLCSDDILREEWFRIVSQTFGESVPATHIGPLFEDLYEQFASGAAWAVVDGAVELFDRLRDRGVRLGVLSNWDSRLPATLEELGLLDRFELLIVSHEVGYEKPHPRIFEEAIRRAAESPARILHVGDSWDFDILPAQRAGIGTLWVAPLSVREAQTNAGPGVETFLELSPRQLEVLFEKGGSLRKSERR